MTYAVTYSELFWLRERLKMSVRFIRVKFIFISSEI